MGRLFGKIRKSFVAVIISILITGVGACNIYSVEAVAAEASQNQQLADYYTALAQMGGNETTSREEALKLASYYAELAAREASGGAQTTASQGTILQVVNVNASQDFYNKEFGIINSLPEVVKKKLNDRGTVFYLYDRPEYFGEAYSVAGMTKTTRYTSGRGGRRTEFSIDLAEHCSTGLPYDFVIYHEVGHAVDYMVWEKSGARAASTNVFDACVTQEYQAIRSIAGYTNYSNTYTEYFADAYAEFYLRTAQMQQRAPYMFNYIMSLAF